MSPEDHDRLLADVSHLPHLLAAAPVAMQDDAGLELSGKGFWIPPESPAATAACGGNFLDNADNVKAGLRRLQSQLAIVEMMLDSKSKDALRDWLDAAAQRRREKVLEKKLREINPD